MSQFRNWPWREWALRTPDTTALVLDQQTISWQQLVIKIDALAAHFSRQGVAVGQGVALRGKNSEWLLLGYLAVLQLGARALPLNPQLPDSLLCQLLPSLNIDYGWSDLPYDWPIELSTIILPSAITKPITVHKEIQPAEWQADRAASMTLTSGSSGLPNAVVHSIGAHLANAQGLLQKMQFEVGDSWLLSLPIFHVSGQSIIWRWLLKGASLVLRDLHPLSDALHGCSHASLVPTQLWRLLSQPLQSLSLKQVLLGGAMIPVELTEQAAQAGIDCWCGYGMTEMASTVCAKRADELPGVGQLLPNREMEIVDSEIWLKGPSLALGYWKNGAILPLVDRQGWYHTRDRGVFERGELRIIGRMDNLFFSGGEGIQPEDIERILAGHSQVELAFILPVEDAEFGQRPVAVIQCQDGFAPESLADWLQGKIARFQMPIAYYRLPESLKSGGIKIARKTISDWLKTL